MPERGRLIKQQPSTPRRFGRPPGGDSVETRRRLLDAAKIVFAERGYKDASNKLIAAAAAISSGAIYHYFATKQAMFLAVHQQLQDDQLGRLEPIVNQSDTLAAALSSLLKAITDGRQSDPHSSPFFSVVRLEARRNPEISAALDDSRWLHLYDRLALLGVKSGELESNNFRSFKAFLAVLLFGITQHAAESTPSAHAAALHGLELLLGGELLRVQARCQP